MQIIHNFIISNKFISQSMSYPTKAKRILTQFSEDFQHLCVELPSLWNIPKKQSSYSTQNNNDSSALETNFGFSIQNPYAFLLLHLRNESNKNIININIPEVCIFVDKVPYEIVSAKNKHIVGWRNQQHPRLTLKQVYRQFKQSWVTKSLPKLQQCVATFSNNEKEMLSENDLYLVCCKTKIDPYFKKLICIKNKLPQNNNQPIISPYPPKPLPLQQGQLYPKEVNYVKIATQCLLGFKQPKLEKDVSEIEYLNIQNQKIALFLNYQHNIRIKSAEFVYIKTSTDLYYLYDVNHIRFDNLTKALRKRQLFLSKKQEQRQQILFMSAQKEAKYQKHYGQNSAQIRDYQKVMTNQFNSLVHKFKLNTMSDNRREEVKNQLAFKRLHPKSKFTYNQIVTSSNFMENKNKLFNIPMRKELTVPSRHMMRFYNQVKNKEKRIKTQTIDTWSGL